MENLGLNNDVTVGGRKVHVQTNYSKAQGRIICNAFLNGQVIDSKEVRIGEDLPVEEISKTMNQSHQEMIAELEILFYIAEKVKTVRHAPSANKLGLLFMKKNLIEEAVEQFKIALEIDPNFSEVYANLGRAFLLMNGFEQAIAVLKKGLKQAPNYADLHNYLGIAYIHQKNYEAAIRHLDEALKRNPNYWDAHYNLGLALLADSLSHKNEHDPEVDLSLKKAVQHLQRAAEKMENHLVDNLQSALRSIKQGDYSKAVNLLLENISDGNLNQNFDYENEFYLKFMYGGKGKDDSFIADYVQRLRAVINKHPHYADLRNHLGIAYLIQCRNLFFKSLEEFRTALKINPDFRKAEKNLKLAENDGKGFLILLRALLK